MSTEEHQFEYQNEDSFITSDNYRVNVKAVVGHSMDDNRMVNSSVEKTLAGYINSLDLMDALDLVNEESYSKISMLINEKLDHELSTFVIKTVDAVESRAEIDVSIDPSLENQKERRGIFGKLKAKFFS